MFTHKSVSFEKPIQVIKNNFKNYIIPIDKYFPSITTILNKTKSDDARENLKIWYEREKEAADHIVALSQIYGLKTHKAIEKTLHNKIPNLSSEMVSLHYNNLFKYIKKIDNITGIELPVYSEKLGIGGTVDCVAEYQGVMSVIDYKTKRKPQKESYLEDPFIQATFYSMAYTELTKIPISQIVILVSDEHGGSEEFIKNPIHYKDKLLERIEMYKEIVNG